MTAQLIIICRPLDTCIDSRGSHGLSSYSSVGPDLEEECGTIAQGPSPLDCTTAIAATLVFLSSSYTRALKKSAIRE